MRSQASVLERNLELLFARAYAPVRAPSDLRARLLRELSLQPLLQIAVRQPVRPLFPLRYWRAAAAILLGIGGAFLAWRVAQSPALAGRVESLLAAGRAAVREGPTDAWRPLSDEENRSGVRFAGPSLELATPRDIPAQVVLGSEGQDSEGRGSGGRIWAQGSSRLTFEGAGGEDGLLVAIASGSVSVERRGTGKTWRVSTSEGAILLDRGALEVACLDWHGSSATRALLRSGAAALDLDPRAGLVPGIEVWLQDGALVAGGALDSLAQASSERTEAGSATGSEPPTAVASAPSTSSLRGTLAVPPGARMPDAYLITLLRRERLPEVSLADPHGFREAAFAIDGLQPGSYSVFVEAPGFATWQRTDVELSAGAPPVALEILLDVGASARGRVLDCEGRPVVGGIVLSETDVPSQLLQFSLERMPAKWNATATTQVDGTFELLHLSRGRHRLRASRAGHGAAWSETIDLSAGDATDLTLRLVQPGALEGRVARDDGTPWPGAIVVASWIDTSGSFSGRSCLNYGFASADVLGRYAIEDLPPGQYVVLNVLEGREPGSTQVPRVQNVRVEAGVRTRVDLPGSDSGTAVEGTLVASDGTPLGDLDVTFAPKTREGGDWKSTRSRADGRFDFPSLPPGSYVICVGGNLGAELAFQGEIEVPAVPIFRYTVRAGSGVLRGRVLDAGTGEGVPSSVIILEIESADGRTCVGRVVSDAQGRYVLPRLLRGKYRVIAYSATRRLGQEASEGVSIGEDASETVLDFQLRPGAGLLVKVIDGDGRPVAGAVLRFLDAHGSSFTFSPEDRTDPKGLLRILGIHPGSWTIRASSESFESSSTAIDLVADEESTVEITLRSSH